MIQFYFFKGWIFLILLKFYKLLIILLIILNLKTNFQLIIKLYSLLNLINLTEYSVKKFKKN